jgi:hypothetical protein
MVLPIWGCSGVGACGTRAFMLWLIILGVVGVLGFVLFRKPAINNVGITYTPSVQPSVAPQMVQPPAGSPVLPQPKQIDTYDFNDLFATKKPDQNDRPQA